LDYAKDVLKKNDPKEFIIAINEFCYHLSTHSKNVVNACYWVEWILEFEAVCKSKKELCLGESREFVSVMDKYKHDIIWIIWDSIFSECKKRGCVLISKIVKSLLDIFCIKYSGGVKRRRRFLIYFAIALLTEPIDLGIEIVTNKDHIDSIVKKINLVYKDVKKNESNIGKTPIENEGEKDYKKITFLKKQEFIVNSSSFLPRLTK
jgi:hypothetical protein